jgi:hypothetical protein
MVLLLQYLTMFSSTSPFSNLTCGGIHTEKKKRQKKSFFIYGTTFKKNESGRDFQRGQIWNDRSQKQKRITAVTQSGSNSSWVSP